MKYMIWIVFNKQIKSKPGIQWEFASLPMKWKPFSMGLDPESTTFADLKRKVMTEQRFPTHPSIYIFKAGLELEEGLEWFNVLRGYSPTEIPLNPLEKPSSISMETLKPSGRIPLWTKKDPNRVKRKWTRRKALQPA